MNKSDSASGVLLSLVEENGVAVLCDGNGNSSLQENIVILDLTNSSANLTATSLTKNDDERNCSLIDSSNFLTSPRTSEGKENQLLDVDSNLGGDSAKLSNYVYQILNKSYEGKFQLACYDFESDQENKKQLLETKKQTYFCKSKVAKLVVNDEFHRTNSYHVSSDRFLELADLTAKLFPLFIPESFYTKSDQNKSAGGAFHMYYSKQREKEIAIGRLQPRKLKKKVDGEENINTEILNKIRNQINIIDEEYLQFWRTTAVFERREIYKKLDLKKIFEIFPCLSHPLGFTLIQEDFKIYFNKSGDLFYKNWSAIAPKIIALAKTKKGDKDLKEILSQNNIIQGEEHQRTLALILLPYLFKRTTKVTARSKTKISWCPERREVSNSFVNHMKDNSKTFNEQINDAQNELLNLHNDHQLVVRPYVIIFGPSLKEIKAAFVIAGPVKYQFTTAYEAVNLCLQLLLVFNVPYSTICNHIWQFIEKKVYEFELKNMYAGVVALLEKLM